MSYVWLDPYWILTVTLGREWTGSTSFVKKKSGAVLDKIQRKTKTPLPRSEKAAGQPPRYSVSNKKSVSDGNVFSTSRIPASSAGVVVPPTSKQLNRRSWPASPARAHVEPLREQDKNELYQISRNFGPSEQQQLLDKPTWHEHDNKWIYEQNSAIPVNFVRPVKANGQPRDGGPAKGGLLPRRTTVFLDENGRLCEHHDNWTVKCDQTMKNYIFDGGRRVLRTVFYKQYKN